MCEVIAIEHQLRPIDERTRLSEQTVEVAADGWMTRGAADALKRLAPEDRDAHARRRIVAVEPSIDVGGRREVNGHRETLRASWRALDLADGAQLSGSERLHATGDRAMGGNVDAQRRTFEHPAMRDVLGAHFETNRLPKAKAQ